MYDQYRIPEVLQEGGQRGPITENTTLSSGDKKYIVELYKSGIPHNYELYILSTVRHDHLIAHYVNSFTSEICSGLGLRLGNTSLAYRLSVIM